MMPFFSIKQHKIVDAKAFLGNFGLWKIWSLTPQRLHPDASVGTYSLFSERAGFASAAFTL